MVIKRINECRKQFLNFKELYSEKRCEEIPLKKCRLFCDWVLCLILLGASAEDYFIYRFYELSWYSRKNFVTSIKSMFIIRKFNHNGVEGRKKVEDKCLFIDEFNGYIHREAIKSETITFKEFCDFIKIHGRAIIKPVNGFNGNGIFCINSDDSQKKYQDVFDSFKEGRYVIEEVLEQEGWLYDLNPGTLNTLRINVINNDNKFEIQNAILRSGQGNTVTDNICAGGVVCWVDVSTGLVVSGFVDLANKHCHAHPLTGTVAIGRNIPQWNNVKKVAIEAAQKVPDLKYTSWDIAVTKGEKIAIVEGNSYGNFNIQQVIFQKGVLNQYKKYF